MKVGEYSLINSDKVERALNGTPQANGVAIGGVGAGAYFEDLWKRDGKELSETEVSELNRRLLAEYDKLGGCIKRGDDKVKTGSFYDFSARKPRVEPQIVFTYIVNGKNIDVADGVQLPGMVVAAKVMAEEAKKTKKSKRTRDVDE